MIDANGLIIQIDYLLLPRLLSFAPKSHVKSILRSQIDGNAHQTTEASIRLLGFYAILF